MKIKLTSALLAMLILLSSVFMASCDLSRLAETLSDNDEIKDIIDKTGLSEILPDIGDEFESKIEGRIYFHNSKEQAMLVSCSGGLICLYSDEAGVFEGFDTGDLVEVWCGEIMESYPAQTYISRIKLLENGDENSFTDEEKDELIMFYGSFGNEFVGNNSGSAGEGRIYFPEKRDKALLLDNYGGLTWLYAQDKSIFDGIDTGDYVRVNHGGVMLSYPGQTNISRITLLSDGDESDFTDEEMKMIERVLD